jgi:hypothetical protein
MVGQKVLKLLLPNLRAESKKLMLLVRSAFVRGNDFLNLSTTLLPGHVGVVDEGSAK